MPIILPADLHTQLYPEVQQIITRGDDTIAEKAISSAISDAKSFLARYDLIAIFGNDFASPPVAASFTDEFLNDIIRSIAVWHLLRLASPGIDLSVANTWYENAMRNLKQISTGVRNPTIPGTNMPWPYRDTSADTAPQGNSIYFNSNPRVDTFW